MAARSGRRFNLRRKLKFCSIIDELSILETIDVLCLLEDKPPTARELMRMRWSFASVMLRIDTLRMWLLRHSRKNVLRKTKDRRSYRYGLTKQGKKRIEYLKERKRKIEDFHHKL